MKKLSLYLLSIFLVGVSTIALSDWAAKDAGGLNVIFDAITLSGGKQLQKTINTDATGSPVGTSANPVSVTMAEGGVTVDVTPAAALKVDGSAVTQPVSGTLGATQGGAWNVGLTGALPTGSNTIGNVAQANAPWAMNLSHVNGSAIAVGNPISAQIAQGGAVVAAGNPLPMTCVSGCTTGATNDSTLATYSASVTYTSPSNTGDASCVIGSATKTVRVRKLSVSAYVGASPVVILLNLTKRGTANTGGSANTINIATHDSTDATATASAVYYSGIPTTGSDAGKVAVFPYYNSGTVPVRDLTWGVGVRGDKSIVLRGTGELLCLAGAPAGNTVYVNWEWTEE